MFMETDDRAGKFGGRILSNAHQQRPVLHPRLPLQNADVVSVEKVFHACTSASAGGRSAARIARPNASTSSKAGSSLNEPVMRATQFVATGRWARRCCNSLTACSTADKRCSIDVSVGSLSPYTPYIRRRSIPPIWLQRDSYSFRIRSSVLTGNLRCRTPPVSCGPQEKTSGPAQKACAVGRQLQWVVRPGLRFARPDPISTPLAHGLGMPAVRGRAGAGYAECASSHRSCPSVGA